MGCEGLGASVATSLSEQGHTVYMIDPRPEAFDRLPSSKIDDGHIVPVLGDGTSRQDLLSASIQEADVFMALTDQDVTNALAGQLAEHIFQVATVICRIDDPTRQQMYDDLGMVTISARTMATQMVVEAATR
jgi:trk system potassium uptake protein TrkA